MLPGRECLHGFFLGKSRRFHSIDGFGVFGGAEKERWVDVQVAPRGIGGGHVRELTKEISLLVGQGVGILLFRGRVAENLAFRADPVTRSEIVGIFGLLPLRFSADRVLLCRRFELLLQRLLGGVHKHAVPLFVGGIEGFQGFGKPLGRGRLLLPGWIGFECVGLRLRVCGQFRNCGALHPGLFHGFVKGQILGRRFGNAFGLRLRGGLPGFIGLHRLRVDGVRKLIVAGHVLIDGRGFGVQHLPAERHLPHAFPDGRNLVQRDSLRLRKEGFIIPGVGFFLKVEVFFQLGHTGLLLLHELLAGHVDGLRRQRGDAFCHKLVGGHYPEFSQFHRPVGNFPPFGRQGLVSL